jgi:hypothetical protein
VAFYEMGKRNELVFEKEFEMSGYEIDSKCKTRKPNNNDIDPHEVIAIRFVDIIYDIRDLQKARKKDSKIIPAIAEHLAEMLRGSDDLAFLQNLISQAAISLAKKEKHTDQTADVLEVSLRSSEEELDLMDKFETEDKPDSD